MQKMRTYLRREALQNQALVDWSQLHRNALVLARQRENYRMVTYLESQVDEPERALRRIGILSLTDLHRELG